MLDHKKKILFIFDKVTHYQKNLFVTLEKRLKENNGELYLLSGNTKKNAKGRVGLNSKIIANEFKFDFFDINFYSYHIRFQKNIFDRIAEIKPDTVVIQSHVGTMTAWKIGRLKNKHNYRLVSWQCGYEYHDNLIKFKLTDLFLKYFDFHLAYHTNAKKYLLEHGTDENKIIVINNTIDETRVKLVDKEIAREGLLKQYPQIKDKIIVLYVGVILKEKKLDYLISSFLKMNKNDQVLFIVGDGDYLEHLKTNYSDNRIIFTGQIIDGVNQYFAAGDIFVLPGTGGLALNEAMAHSLPIISGFADGSADDLVQHGKNGFRLKEYTEDEFINYLNLLSGDKHLREQFGCYGNKLIFNEFSFNNFIRKIILGLELPDSK